MINEEQTNKGYQRDELTFEYDDNKIYGVAYVPNEDEYKMPTLILSHGYNGSYSHMEDLAKALAEQGVLTYCYDFCGGSNNSKSTGKSIDMSIKTEQEDLKVVIDMLRAWDKVDARRIYLYGESQGGFVSALVAAELKDRIAGLLLLYPAFCIPEDWLKRNPNDFTGYVNVMGMELSKKFYDEVPRYDIFEYMSAFDKPVKIFHGDKDRLVNQKYIEKAVEYFPNATMEIFEGEGHGFSQKARARLIEEISDFFKGI